MSEIIAFTSGKGGTGKSTVCAGVGTALANSGKKVLIIELDFGFRCLDVFLAIKNEIKSDIFDYISEKCSAEECIIKTQTTPNLSLIPAPSHHIGEINPERIKKLIKEHEKQYDFILLDTGAGMQKEIIETLKICNNIVFVVTPDLISMRDASKLSDEFYRYGCENQRLIINKVDRKYIENGIVKNLDAVITETGIQLLGVVPDDNELLLFYGLGKRLSYSSVGYTTFKAIAGRLRGENIPLAIL